MEHTKISLPKTSARGPRTDGWTPERQRTFIEALAAEGSVKRACDACGLSRRSAYNLRFRADGAAFRLGWDAAILIARARLADDILERAIEGQEETITRNGDTVTRHRIDNRLAMSMLSRLDRMADADTGTGTDAALARIVSQDFEAFLDILGQEGGADAAPLGPTAAAALFIAARRPAETDPFAALAMGPMGMGMPGLGAMDFGRNGRCELPDEDEGEGEEESLGSVWYDLEESCWKTDYPAPPGFAGVEEYDEDAIKRGERGYCRTLTREEERAQDALLARENAALDAEAAAERDRHFGFVPAALPDALPDAPDAPA